jgi:TFIIF-interacting CTD phosphatase-like protein
MPQKCVILDCDNCLLFSPETPGVAQKLDDIGINLPENYDIKCRIHKMDIPDIVNSPGTGELDCIYFIERPHLPQFLNFIRNYFDYVVVWSAGKPRYVRGLVERIFRDVVVKNNKPIVDMILTSNDMVTEANRDYCKPISKVCEKIPFIRPENLLIIDDRAANFVRNLGNGILIPAFNPELTLNDLRRDDTALLDIIRFLSNDTVKKCTDYRKLDKSKIFTSN